MAHVLLFTDRTELASKLHALCAKAALEVQASSSTTVAEMAGEALAAVFDASAEIFDEDELLASVGLVRALGALPAVILAANGRHGGIEDLLHELCMGCVVDERDVSLERLASSLARRCEEGRERRFEYLSVSPQGAALLAVLGDGRALLVPRPLNAQDDGSEVKAIHLAQDAQSAEVELTSGLRVALASHELKDSNGAASQAAGLGEVDGATLGRRLRELRLAAGLTQAELARRTGIHRPNIARVEAGRHTPSLETLARLAQAIGVSTTRVLSG
jgi:DNA-binding XRE family transcriptional regulator